MPMVGRYKRLTGALGRLRGVTQITTVMRVTHARIRVFDFSAMCWAGKCRQPHDAAGTTERYQDGIVR